VVCRHEAGPTSPIGIGRIKALEKQLQRKLHLLRRVKVPVIVEGGIAEGAIRVREIHRW
jgi:hypothetical protein